MFKYLFIITFAACLWFICSDWGMSKYDYDRISSQIQSMEQSRLETWAKMKELELKNEKKIPEHKKWPR